MIATAAAGLSVGLTGCLESQARLGDDFGAAVRQDAVAQITDPEGRYRRAPAPAANGVRAALAQERYQTDKSIEPTATASKISGGMTGAAASAGP
jgi:hypothetical protein